MAVVIVLMLMGAFGLFRGLQIVFSGCSEITFDGSERLGGRLYLIEWGCLDDGLITGSSMPGLLTGLGLVLAGILGLTSFLWLSAIFSLWSRLKSRGLPETPITAYYRDTYKITLKEFLRLNPRAKVADSDEVSNQLYLSILLGVHVRTWQGLSEIKFEFSGRDGRFQEGEIWKCFHGDMNEVVEWIMLANAGQIGSRSQQELWEKLCEPNSPLMINTPLGNLAKRLGTAALGNPPFEYLGGSKRSARSGKYV